MRLTSLAQALTSPLLLACVWRCLTPPASSCTRAMPMALPAAVWTTLPPPPRRCCPAPSSVCSLRGADGLLDPAHTCLPCACLTACYHLLRGKPPCTGTFAGYAHFLTNIRIPASASSCERASTMQGSISRWVAALGGLPTFPVQGLRITTPTLLPHHMFGPTHSRDDAKPKNNESVMMSSLWSRS